MDDMSRKAWWLTGAAVAGCISSFGSRAIEPDERCTSLPLADLFAFGYRRELESFLLGKPAASVVVEAGESASPL